jgi:hypothetical protein
MWTNRSKNELRIAAELRGIAHFTLACNVAFGWKRFQMAEMMALLLHDSLETPAKQSLGAFTPAE